MSGQTGLVYSATRPGNPILFSVHSSVFILVFLPVLLHQRLASEHNSAGRGGSRGEARRVRGGRRLQVRSDQTEVCTRRLPGFSW